MGPFVTELLISLVLSFIIALAYRFLTDPKEIKRIKEDVKSYRKRIKEAQKAGKQDEANRLMTESLKANQKMMSQSMKPMLVSMAVFFVMVYGVMGPMFAGVVELTLPFALPLPFYSSVFGFIPFPGIAMRISIGWLWWYILITAPGIQIFRKLLGVE